MLHKEEEGARSTIKGLGWVMLKSSSNNDTNYSFATKAVSAMHPAGQSIVAFRPNKARSNEDDETYKGSLLNYDEFSIFATDKCTPLVREITFEVRPLS